MASIILAEDDAGIGQIYKKWLEAEGHSVMLVDDGGEGFAASIFDTAPDLIVTDIMMPGTDGEAFSRMLGILHKKLPVIVVTAMTDGERRKAISELENVKAVLSKPIEREALLKCVDEALGEKKG